MNNWHIAVVVAVFMFFLIYIFSFEKECSVLVEQFFYIVEEVKYNFTKIILDY